MEIETALTKKAYVRLNLALILRSKATYVINAVFILAMLAVGLTFERFGFIVAVILGYVAFVSASYFLGALRMALSPKNRTFFLPTKYKFEDIGVSVSTPLTEGKFAWSAFVRWRKAGGQYLVYPSAKTFFAVPQSAIPTPSREEFESLLKSKIG